MTEVPFLGWIVTQSGQFFHVLPRNDLREHEVDPDCFCRPVFDARDNLMMHQSTDRREHTYEQGIVN